MSRNVKWTNMMFDDVYGSKDDKKCVLPPITIINQYITQPENEVIEIVDQDDEIGNDNPMNYVYENRENR